MFTGLLTRYPLNPGSIRDKVTALSFPQSNQIDSEVQRASYSMGTYFKWLCSDDNHSSPLIYSMYRDNFIFRFFYSWFIYLPVLSLGQNWFRASNGRAIYE